MGSPSNVTVRPLAVTAGRLAGIAAITLVAWIAILAGAYISMVADFPAGKVLIVGLASGVAIIVVLTMSRWAHVDRRGGAVIGAAAGLAFGVWALAILPPGPHALAAALNKIGDPDGLRRIRQSAGGATICFDTCPHAARTYRTDLPHPEALRRLAAVARLAGYRIASSADQGDEWRATKGRYLLSARFGAANYGTDPRLLYVNIEKS